MKKVFFLALAVIISLSLLCVVNGCAGTGSTITPTAPAGAQDEANPQADFGLRVTNSSIFSDAGGRAVAARSKDLPADLGLEVSVSDCQVSQDGMSWTTIFTNAREFNLLSGNATGGDGETIQLDNYPPAGTYKYMKFNVNWIKFSSGGEYSQDLAGGLSYQGIQTSPMVMSYNGEYNGQSVQYMQPFEIRNGSTNNIKLNFYMPQDNIAGTFPNCYMAGAPTISLTGDNVNTSYEATLNVAVYNIQNSQHKVFAGVFTSDPSSGGNPVFGGPMSIDARNTATKVLKVPAGNFYVVAFEDVTGDGVPNNGDRFFWYSVNGMNPQSVVVQAGQSYDIALSPAPTPQGPVPGGPMRGTASLEINVTSAGLTPIPVNEKDGMLFAFSTRVFRNPAGPEIKFPPIIFKLVPGNFVGQTYTIEGLPTGVFYISAVLDKDMDLGPGGPTVNDYNGLLLNLGTGQEIPVTLEDNKKTVVNEQIFISKNMM